MSDIYGIGCSSTEHKRLQKVIKSLNHGVKVLQAENDKLRQKIIEWQKRYGLLEDEVEALRHPIKHSMDRLDV